MSLSPEFCRNLIRIYNKYDQETVPEPVDNRPVYQITIYDEGKILNKELWDICKNIPLPRKPYFVFLKRYRSDERPYITAHCDTSTYSYNFLLSSTRDFEGGDLYIFDRPMTNILKEFIRGMSPIEIDKYIASYENLPIVKFEQGDMISYRGDKHLHGTLPVTKGERYLLSFFSK